ncbi:hypothetical protein KJ973_03195 [Patescibacteria group bacterium]|nr:hypothetical protein [Patescibacteria group bacterium]MBU1246366.1 hypothetical protein [Patescibacteria group bacterium]MBU1519670.1 hypothetical protein [Patescibacteria group bacterium]MBU1730210.1 hypothetical protein [Patescibacteria group bacterium]MBU1956733.1 hypothetical protein [Patescibacteria group bacterium]
MIILIYGTDIDSVLKVSRKHLDTLIIKRPEARFFKIDNETFQQAEFEELICGQGLFDRKFIVQLDRVFENTEAKDFILQNVTKMAESENAFVITEDKLTKPIFEKIKKVALKTEEFNKKEVTKKEFNIFLLTDAFGKRDKKQMWILLYQVLRAGLKPEQIHGVLFSQVKNIAFVKWAEKEKIEPNQLSIHPFAQKKARSFVKNFSQTEIESLSRQLLTIYHNAHMGGDELPIALEKFVLNL